MLLFLLNDTVLELDLRSMASPTVAANLARLSFAQAVAIAREAFAAEPDLVRRSPARAHKAAILVLLKQPQINAALFVAPAVHCRAADVSARFASVATETMYEMKGLQDRGRLNPGLVNAYVWSRAESAA